MGEVLREFGGSIPPCTIYDLGPIEALRAAKERLDKELIAEDERHNRKIGDLATAIDNANRKIKELEQE